MMLSPVHGYRVGLWITERRLRKVKTHNLPALIERQIDAIRWEWSFRWHDMARFGDWDGKGPRYVRPYFCSMRRDIQTLRLLRAELARRQGLPPTPKHNHGKGDRCPMPPLPAPVWPGR